MPIAPKTLLKTISPLAALIAAFAARGAQPQFVTGTYQKGSNITEPRPCHSRFLQTTSGGIVIIGENAGYYLDTKVIEKPKNELYITIEYENPAGRTIHE
jgi:hypothetical protein